MKRKSDLKKFNRRLSALVLALAVMLAPTLTARATEGSSGSKREIPAVSYYGEARQFVFTPGDEGNPADLFDSFKGLMPGDEREQEITLRSAAESGAPINLFLRAYVPALDENATEAQKAEADKAKEFLEKLKVKITSDEFSDRPMLDAGDYQEQGMESWVFLGRFAYNTTSVLHLKVSVPVELGDEYQGMEAVVRFAFLVEEYNDTTSPSDPGNGQDPTNPTNPQNPQNQTQNGTNPEGTGGQTPGGTAQTLNPVQNLQGGAAQGGAVTATDVQGSEAGNANGSEMLELEDIPTPLAAPADEELGIADEEVPLAVYNGSSWALLNLLLTIVTVMACVMLLVYDRRNQNEEEDRTEDRKQKKALQLSGIVPAAGAAIVFLLTENMSSRMVFADRWTWLMMLIAVAEGAVCVLAYKGRIRGESKIM